MADMNMKTIKDFVDLIKETKAFIVEKKSYWLAPLIFALLVAGMFLVVLEGSALAPLIYTVF